MPEGQFVCAEPESLWAMSGIRVWIVLGIARNGAAYMCKLNADLMMASGVEGHL